MKVTARPWCGTLFLFAVASLLCAGALHAQSPAGTDPLYGPFNDVFLPDGDGLENSGGFGFGERGLRGVWRRGFLNSAIGQSGQKRCPGNQAHASGFIKR